MRLQERLAQPEVVILDGATGTELERRGVPMDDVAWSGAAILSHIDVLRAVHADYIRAGAEIVTTNTFATSRTMLAAAGLADEVRAINRAAVDAARVARDEAAGERAVWIAGSISPMAPGTDPARRAHVRFAAAEFREQAEILAEAGVDLILLEMMRDVDYTQAALTAAAATGLPVWVGFSCVRSAAGEIVMAPGIVRDLPFETVMREVDLRQASLVAVMHTAVEDTRPALEIAREGWPALLGAYAHSGGFAMPHWQFDEVVAPEDYLGEAERWAAMGVQVIGGCCGIGPEHIRRLADRFGPIE